MPIGKSCSKGFTYITVLVLLFILGLGQIKLSGIWQAETARQKEQELLSIGHEFRQAIGRYYEQSPGTVKRYPRSLNDLLEDQRFLAITRHLRRIYLDPITGKPQWGTVAAPDGGVMGVHSLSSAQPYKHQGFSLADQSFAEAKTYRDWVFFYRPSAKDANPEGVR